MIPAHLVDDVDVTLCGLERSTDPRYPIVHPRHALAHVNGWGLRICAGCIDALGLFVDPELAEAAAFRD